jgi:hypothetical protein
VRDFANLGNGSARISGFRDGITGAFQRQTQNATQAFLIFGEKNVRHGKQWSVVSDRWSVVSGQWSVLEIAAGH